MFNLLLPLDFKNTFFFILKTTKCTEKMYWTQNDSFLSTTIMQNTFNFNKYLACCTCVMCRNTCRTSRKV